MKCSTVFGDRSNRRAKEKKLKKEKGSIQKVLPAGTEARKRSFAHKCSAFSYQFLAPVVFSLDACLSGISEIMEHRAYSCG